MVVHALALSVSSFLAAEGAGYPAHFDYSSCSKTRRTCSAGGSLVGSFPDCAMGRSLASVAVENNRRLRGSQAPRLSWLIRRQLIRQKTDC